MKNSGILQLMKMRPYIHPDCCLNTFDVNIGTSGRRPYNKRAAAQIETAARCSFFFHLTMSWALRAAMLDIRKMQLYRSVRTVEEERNHIMHKLNVDNLIDLVKKNTVMRIPESLS